MRISKSSACEGGLPVRLVVLLVFVLSPLLCSGENFYEDKKSDQNRPFYMGSRYGRSGHVSKQVQVTPRTDRNFFLGSRYGKRAASGGDLDDLLPPYLGNTLGDLQDSDAHQIMGSENGNILGFAQDPSFHQQHMSRLLKCSYLGLGNIYKCRDIDQAI